MNTRWGTVLTADEPPALLAAYVAHHLDLGAAEVHLYLDRPDDPGADMLSSLDGVHVTRCDAAHWSALGGRPQVHVQRQTLNANHAYGRAGTDWLLHSDADEYLTGDPDRSLAGVDASIDTVIVPVGERVFAGEELSDDLFHGHVLWAFESGRAARRVFGPDAKYLLKGMTAHTAGKSFSRVGRNRFVGIHKTKARDANGQRDGKAEVPGITSSDLRLVHFDGMTRLHWATKLYKKCQSGQSRAALTKRLRPHRVAQIDEVLASGGDQDAVIRLHNRLRVFGAEKLGQLAANGQAEPIRFDPAAAARRLFPSADLDFAATSFDAVLIAREPDWQASEATRLG